MDGGPGLGGDLVPHRIRADESADPLPAGAGDAHRQKRKFSKPLPEMLQSPAHRPLRIPGGAEILKVDQAAVGVHEHQVGAGGSYVDTQGAALQRDRARGGGVCQRNAGGLG